MADEDKRDDVDGNAHVVMVPQYITYVPGVKTYTVLDETEEYYIIDSGIEGSPGTIEKSRCKAVSVTISGEIR